MPRDLDADAKDLHALIHARTIATPVILVGHSLGTNIVRRFADKHPADVAGIVLVDPPPQRISEFSKDWVKTDNETHEKVIAFAKMCGKAASAGQLAKPAGDAAQVHPSARSALSRCIERGDPCAEGEAAVLAHARSPSSRPT